MLRRSVFLLALFLVILSLLSTGARPWQRRRGRDVEVRHKLAYEVVKPQEWPAEPESPGEVDAKRLAASLQKLCLWMPAARSVRYAKAVIAAAEAFDQDPFLLGALMFERSSCLPRTPDAATGIGLTRIDLKMHGPHIRAGEYRFYRSDGEDGWKREVLPVRQHLFNQWKLQRPEPNFYFAAAVLGVFQRQCADLDARLGGAPHRHFVSHFYFGDRVSSGEPEDRVLTVRRRLIEYYVGQGRSVAGQFEELELVAPLDGAPRVVIDYFGNGREYRRKRGYFHKGIDIEALTGEPARSLAAGRVVFAGVDLPGPASSRYLSRGDKIPARRTMGPGGLYVCVNHQGRFKSCYMHLSEIRVENGQQLRAGDVVGLVGSSGTSLSGSHLHLEFRVDGRHVDPLGYLNRGLIVPSRGAEKKVEHQKKVRLGS